MTSTSVVVQRNVTVLPTALDANALNTTLVGAFTGGIHWFRPRTTPALF